MSSALEGIEYLPWVWSAVFAAILLWAIFDMAAIPASDWRRAGYRKGMWIWGSLVLGLALAPIVTTVYVGRVRPKVTGAAPRESLAKEQDLSMADVLTNWPSDRP